MVILQIPKHLFDTDYVYKFDLDYFGEDTEYGTLLLVTNVGSYSLDKYFGLSTSLKNFRYGT